MSYVPTIALLVFGLVVLGVLVVRLVMGLRRFNRTVNMVLTSSRDRVGLLRARTAGVRVAITQRKNAKGHPAASGAVTAPAYDRGTGQADRVRMPRKIQEESYASGAN